MIDLVDQNAHDTIIYQTSSTIIDLLLITQLQHNIIIFYQTYMHTQIEFII